MSVQRFQVYHCGYAVSFLMQLYGQGNHHICSKLWAKILQESYLAKIFKSPKVSTSANFIYIPEKIKENKQFDYRVYSLLR